MPGKIPTAYKIGVALIVIAMICDLVGVWLLVTKERGAAPNWAISLFSISCMAMLPGIQMFLKGRRQAREAAEREASWDAGKGGRASAGTERG